MFAALPSCFRGGEAAVPPASTAAAPTVTTSVYETPLGLAALTWSRPAVGLCLRSDLRLPSAASSSSSSSPAEDETFVPSSASAKFTDASFGFRLRPSLFWKRRGSKRFHLKGRLHSGQQHSNRTVDFVWDLTRARFPPGGGPEPHAGFFVAIVVDGQMFLVVGDMEREAYKKTKARRPCPSNPSKNGSHGNSILVSRTEHVPLPSSGRTYTTRARFGGKEREISIYLCGAGSKREAKMSVGLDGKRILRVKQLKWKFRGNERLEVEGGVGVQISWDVHGWLFDGHSDPLAPVPNSMAESGGHAVFVFQLDGQEEEQEGTRLDSGKHWKSSTIRGGLWSFSGVGDLGNSCRSSSGCGRDGGVVVGRSKGAAQSSRLLKTSSFSSSSSSATSKSNSSVMEWGSAEEGELCGTDGFSLLVFLWKS